LKDRTIRYLVLGLVGLIFFFGSLLYSQLEKKRIKVKFDPNVEARSNPRLAAMKLLERFGLSTRAVHNPDVMPATGAVVLLPSSVYLDPSRVSRWRQWVSDGGILVVGLDLIEESRDPLLEGITRTERYVGRTEEAEAESAAESGAEDASSVEPETSVEEASSAEDVNSAEDASGAEPEASAEADNEAESEPDDVWSFPPLSGDSDPEFRLAIKRTWVIPPRDIKRSEVFYTIDAEGVVGFFAEGQGYLVVMADDSIFDNNRIAKQDHAGFLWHLVHLREAPSEVVVLLGDRLGLLSWLWRVAWPLIVTLLLLTLMFIWEKGPRFGPAIEPSAPGRRGLRDHLRATSAFLWRHHEQSALLEPLRAEVLRRAGIAIPGWPAMDKVRCRAELAKISRLPQKAIADALQEDPHRDPELFVSYVATLETLRKAL